MDLFSLIPKQIVTALILTALKSISREVANEILNAIDKLETVAAKTANPYDDMLVSSFRYLISMVGPGSIK